MKESSDDIHMDFPIINGVKMFLPLHLQKRFSVEVFRCADCLSLYGFSFAVIADRCSEGKLLLTRSDVASRLSDDAQGTNIYSGWTTCERRSLVDFATLAHNINH
ncbi:hypothetical protein C5167_010282 [Papaver somniferum]|uniref:Uncharacterized protein n=1 Tax=Papaver somniferum TaxID=3469 RepID=A0A4Y7JZT1_PAPSO|nr:hypothetical protein C5167_010282 [Papaver somniferum]